MATRGGIVNRGHWKFFTNALNQYRVQLIQLKSGDYRVGVCRFFRRAEELDTIEEENSSDQEATYVPTGRSCFMPMVAWKQFVDEVAVIDEAVNAEIQGK